MTGREGAAAQRRLMGAQAVRFGLVGCSNFLVTLAVFRLLLLVPVEVVFRVGGAQFLAYGVGTVWSFFLNRRFTFRSRGAAGGQFPRFVALQVALALGSSLVIDALVARYPARTWLIWVGTMGVVAVINFVVCRTWVYRERA